MIHGHKTPLISAADADLPRPALDRFAWRSHNDRRFQRTERAIETQEADHFHGRQGLHDRTLNLGESLHEFVETAIVGQETVELFFDVGNLRVHVARQSA